MHNGNGENKRVVKIVVFSDTHNEHESLTIPDGDILIHCGDFTHKADWKGLEDAEVPKSLTTFNQYLGTLPHPHKLIISGNHEIGFNKMKRRQIQKHLSNATYLEDSSVTIKGIKFYGTPWTSSSNMAFSASREKLARKWKQIPRDTDILITHLPPLGVLDLAWIGDRGKDSACRLCGEVHSRHSHWGCDTLLKTILHEVQPKVHLFGHVHDEPGMKDIEGVTFINAACRVTSFEYPLPSL